MASLRARSAIVRATFRQRCRRRPDQPSRSAALRTKRAAASGFLRDAAALARLQDGITVYPPVPPFIAKVADVERMQMLLESPSRAVLQRMLADWLPALHGLRASHKGVIRWAIDVDPLAI